MINQLFSLCSWDLNLVKGWYNSFGATNQLLSGLVLLVVVVWLKKTGRKAGFAIVPMVFMNGMTIWALLMLLSEYRLSPVGIIAGVLLLLAFILMIEGYKTFRKLIADSSI